MILLFSILIALAVVLTALGVDLIRRGGGVREIAARLRALGRRDDEPEAFGLERDDRYSAVPWFDRVLHQLNLGERLELLLYQAGLTMRAGTVVLLCGVAGVFAYLIGIAVFHRVYIGFLLMVLATPAPVLWVVMRKNARMKAFANSFPDALDLLVSALRAGLSFSAAMQIVSEESPEPLATEFAITVEEQSLGLDVREAMLNLTKRVDVLDLKLFVTAVLLQRETGGNLAEVLQRNAALIRDRFRILGDIRTFTAQGRMTAVILSALPIGVAAFTYAASPDYFRPMLDSPGGRTGLWVAGLLQVLGTIIIRRIVQIRV
jgi:tight adherence protein B